jgi:hypothetical protein
MTKKIILVTFLFTLLTSCKTTKAVSDTKTAEKSSIEQVIKGHNDNFKDFSRLNIKASVRYEDAKDTQNVSADIRIKKDEIIWINIKVFGFPVAKALITPTKVSYYEDINRTYFDGDFTLISNWLGTDLDFQKVQNLLIGKALEDINKDKFTVNIVNNLYQVSQKKQLDIQKTYTFEAGNYVLKNELIYQKSTNRSLDINYVSYVPFENMIFPKEISIKAKQANQVSIDIEYNKFEINQEAPFTFSIPQGHEKVEIK